MEAALYMYSIICFIGFILIFLLAIGYKDKKNYASYFLAFFFLLIVAPLLVVYRANIPAFFSVIVSNTMFIIAYIFLYLGICKLISKRANIALVSTILIVSIGLLLLFTYAFGDIRIRIVILNSAVILILLKTILDIQSLKRKWSFFDEFMSIILVMLILGTLLRTIGVYVFNENSISFLDFNIDPIFLLIIGIINLMVIIGLLSIYQKMTSNELNEIQRSNSSLISNLPGFAYRCYNDKHWTMVFVSKQAKQVTGWEVKEILNNTRTSYEEIILKKYRKLVRDEWNVAIAKKETFIGEYQIKKKNGKTIWVWEQGIPIIESNGSCKYVEGFIMDIDDRKLNENNLEYLSFKDVLTGLYNRRYLKSKLIELENSSNYPISLILGDINNLKFINDSFGHKEGDNALIYVAKSIKSAVRHGEIVRLGGDEFLIVLTNTDEKAVKKVIEEIQLAMTVDNDFLYQVSISLGSATTSDKEISLEEIEKRAENNMYKQKFYSKPSTKRNTVDAVLQTLFEKDKLSEQHSRNVSYYCKKLAQKIGLSKNETEEIETAALLHDVGKIIISKNILVSKDKLNSEEWKEMKQHPEIGFRILHSVPELKEIATYILHHHERIDGKGYPNGIKGDQIPKFSKMITICDAFDAMINKRYYKEEMTLDAAKKELLKCSGTQFDEKLTKQFLEIVDDL
jgi:diguanylate cyclase (GGDEF)-like protein/PAS domain S-box-containing protein/putative nucleotidyltransferase with HDIG domain